MKNIASDMRKEYYIGLDVGTNSVGWAVTDPDYNICKANRKAMWGIRLFDTASTAEERRMNRTARRRRQREKQRIEWLQDFFSEEIAKVDPGFFLRMKESRYVPEDKKDSEGNTPQLPYSLFVDEEYTDKNYHAEFPTIYHLRSTLIHEDDRPFDIRLIYLALHNMMKHRGHFLFEGEGDTTMTFQDIFQEFQQVLSDEIDSRDEDDLEEASERGSFISSLELADQIGDILKDSSHTKNDKKKALEKLTGAASKQEKAILGLLAGTKVSIKDIYNDENLSELDYSKISFSDSNYEEAAASLAEVLMERFYLIEKAKAIYDWALLADIKGDYEYLSDAKVKLYEKHREDLKKLKTVIKQYYPQEYEGIFSTDSENGYSAYIGAYRINGRKYNTDKKCTQEDFYKKIKKWINGSECEDAAYILKEIAQETFLPKQVTKENSVIPHQLHLTEMKRILKNAEKHYTFLAEKDESGKSVSEKILDIFNFKIPYYVGPLNTAMNERGFGWAVRREGASGKIYPWNLEEQIDVEESAERFIRRMTNKCTYLYGKDVLPKYSLLYCKFTVLNELNNLKINGDSISEALKKEIFENLFKRYKRVTMKRLRDYLYSRGYIGKEDQISGIDGDFKSSLRPLIDFKEILTGILYDESLMECMISDITLFGAEKKMLRKRLKARLPEMSDKQAARLAELPYSGWGRLSREFLEEIEAVNPETGELLNIISMMYETNDNLMQLLSEKYKYRQELTERNKGGRNYSLSYETVDSLYVSPAVKRAIWQTLTVVKEIVKVMGCEPKKIFLEMTREEGKKNSRTVSRKARLTELYKKCKSEESYLADKLEKESDEKLRGDKLYLYYTQRGRCMYSGEQIELDDLFTNLYDIDHIYPQAKVMDDSLDNRVLVKRTLNAEKGDNYPLNAKIQKSQRAFWKMLRADGFISQEKYDRLTRTTAFNENELAGFIARQIVETSQSTKAIAEVLQNVYKSDVVYVKAKVVSKFRKKHELLKVRDVNDYHHAKDAYLNIVVGNAYDIRFTRNPLNFVRENQRYSYNIDKLFDKDIVRNGTVAWKGGEGGTIGTVKRTMRKNNILFTRYAYEVKGGLFDQQLMKKGKGQVPIKGSDERLGSIEKYGGYNNAVGAYYMLVASVDKKGKLMRTIECVPVYLKQQLEQDSQSMIRYCEEQLGLKEPRILIDKIKKDTLFKVDGFYMHLSARTGKRLTFKNANQLCLDEDEMALVKKLGKYRERSRKEKNAVFSVHDGVNEQGLMSLYDTLIKKLSDTVYGKRLSAQIGTLTEGRVKFKELSLEEQALVLLQILNLFRCNNENADLKAIGGPGRAGVLGMNKSIDKISQISIIHQSPTGIFEQEIDLLSL